MPRSKQRWAARGQVRVRGFGVAPDPSRFRNEQIGVGVQCPRERTRDRIGVHVVEPSGFVDSQRSHHWHDVLAQQCLEDHGIRGFHVAHPPEVDRFPVDLLRGTPGHAQDAPVGTRKADGPERPHAAALATRRAFNSPRIVHSTTRRSSPVVTRRPLHHAGFKAHALGHLGSVHAAAMDYHDALFVQQLGYGRPELVEDLFTREERPTPI